jgi:hypothetical protein
MKQFQVRVRDVIEGNEVCKKMKRFGYYRPSDSVKDKLKRSAFEAHHKLYPILQFRGDGIIGGMDIDFANKHTYDYPIVTIDDAIAGKL